MKEYIVKIYTPWNEVHTYIVEAKNIFSAENEAVAMHTSCGIEIGYIVTRGVE